MDQNNMNNTSGMTSGIPGMNFVTGEAPVNTTPTVNNLASTPQVNPTPVGATPDAQQVSIPTSVAQTVTEPTPVQPIVQPSPAVVPISSENVGSAVPPVTVVSTSSVATESQTSNIPPVNVQSTVNVTPFTVPTPVEPVQSVGASQPTDNSSSAPIQVPQVAPINQDVNQMSQIMPMQVPVVDNSQVNVNPGDGQDEIKEKKKRNVLVVIVVILLLTVIGIVVGFVLFDKFGNKEESTTSEPVNEEKTFSNGNVYDNVNVDTAKLGEALKIVGIAETSDKENVTMLNYYVSDPSYKEDAGNVIVYYVTQAMNITESSLALPDDYDMKSDIGACSDTVSCSIVSKDDALRIIEMYNLGDSLDKYFHKSSVIEDAYGVHYGGTLVISEFNGPDAGITHNLKAEETDGVITISDSQTIKTYGNDGTLNSEEKNVTYIFKSNNEKLYLDSVSIDE